MQLSNDIWEAGADVHARDSQGRCLLDIADVGIWHAEGVKEYAQFEAIRAWLSGLYGHAVQSPNCETRMGRKELGREFGGLLRNTQRNVMFFLSKKIKQ
jgi:hypothetical protein